MSEDFTSVSLRHALRAETSALHQELEKTVEARGSFASAESYKDWLLIMQQLHSLFAADYDAGCAALGLPKMAALLGEALALDTGVDLPACGKRHLPVGSEIGVAYVFEGSALGARLLLRRTAALAPVPLDYLSTLVAESHDRWPLVKQRCAGQNVAGPASADPVIAGACTVFWRFQRAFAPELV